MTNDSEPTAGGQNRMAPPHEPLADAGAERRYADWLRSELDALGRRSFRRLFCPPGAADSSDFVFGPWAQQGRLFGVDLFNVIAQELFSVPFGSKMTLLDVGAGSGAGTALLASLFSHPWAGYEIACEALEPSREWAELYPALYSGVPLRAERLEDIPDRSYDIVTASHVIEHIERDQVAAFIRKLASVARRFAVVTCPWQEPEPVHPEHRFSVRQDLVDEVAPDAIKIFRSLGWHNPSLAEPLQCIAMVFRSEKTTNAAGRDRPASIAPGRPGRIADLVAALRRGRSR